MATCRRCGRAFPLVLLVDGRRRHLKGRTRCFDCKPYKARGAPVRAVSRPVRVKTCGRCGSTFAAKMIIGGKLRSLYRRRFCLECSPFGGHNTSRQPLGGGPGQESRRKLRRNSSWRRYQLKRTRSDKLGLVRLRGGRCEDCGYHADVAALEFHHRAAADKLFAIGGSIRGWSRLVAEAAKCDLLCASCHRRRHLEARKEDGHYQVLRRREIKERSVAYFGGKCQRCGRDGPAALFEFHHRDPDEKSFGLGQGGLRFGWRRVQDELKKCVMLCPNCHRETHTARRLGHPEATALMVRPVPDPPASLPQVFADRSPCEHLDPPTQRSA